MAQHGTSVFAFEVARTTTRARAMLAHWGQVGRSAARTAAWIDFGLIVAYSAFLLSLAKVLGRRARARNIASATSLTAIASGLAIAAGFANVLAKVGQLVILAPNTQQPYPALAFSAALLNDALLAAAIIACATLGILGFRR